MEKQQNVQAFSQAVREATSAELSLPHSRSHREAHHVSRISSLDDQCCDDTSERPNMTRSTSSEFRVTRNMQQSMYRTDLFSYSDIQINLTQKTAHFIGMIIMSAGARRCMRSTILCHPQLGFILWSDKPRFGICWTPPGKIQ